MDTRTPTSDRQLSGAKRNAILSGAMQEFLAHGYAATTMDRVATAAKVSKATVYSHFKDKEGLFIALVQQLQEQKFQAVYGSPQGQRLQGPPRQVLHHLASTLLANILEDKPFLAFMRLIIGESGRFPELARAFSHHTPRCFLLLLTDYLGSQSGLKLKDPEATARIFIGSLVHYVIFQELLYAREVVPFERDRMIQGLVDLIVKESL
ncbi:TetR/AcrR family transcriptional regulator [Acaryochloris sp. IP29b_bin.137]|uniref:TetR/AcrR family transcriptional regulator n=1 Tax=Acaryochloris sp. IP29b_bin.137 TaxID=2969217 RepID=UPI0026383DD7|nr:TetR/AcrR family transcriptional regulator [Acaryochloris sp. IP29b_bin.137]